jgi:hypothetical protein
MTGKGSEEKDILTVSAWMEEFAATPIDAPPLPDPSYLWWKAQLLRRWDAQRQATAPIDIGERVQVGVGLVGCIALLVWFCRELPSVSEAPSLVAVIILSGVVLITAAALAAWETIGRPIR